MPTQLDIRQSVLRSALNMAGTAANATVDTILPAHDANIGKLFEDRNIFLTDGGTVTFTGTQVQFTEAVNLVLNQKISGAVPQIISLGSASQNFTNNGDMWVAVINRTAGTATTSIITSGNALPAVSAANQEVFLIAKRIDAADGTQRLYFRNGSAFNAGQTARLGSAGSGSGSGGAGDDLDSLQFAADFYDQFTENAANANSSISTAFGTNASFNAAKSMYVLSYDASKTATTSGTAVTMSAAPAYTVAVGDVLISGGVAKKITVVTSQTSYTIESAFATNLAAAACTVSQAVYTKDINNFAVDGSALSAAFPAAFSEIMVDYKDNAITNSNVFTPGTPVIAWSGSPDNTNFTSVATRSSSELVSQSSVILPSAGTSLYLRFFANQTSGSGTVNLINYKAYWQKSVTAAGTTNVLWSTFAMTNNSTTPVNCSVSVVGGKTTITVTNNSYPVGLLTGQTIGALEVLLNGASVDRFVSGSTPTTDAYYTEVSPNVIQLDRDYSSQALSISLIYSLQVIDNSTVNTSSISALQEISQNGFQSFVNQSATMSATTTVGTPAAGTFYSSIQNRAAIVDFTQDLKPRMGSERIMTQMVVPLLTEFGPANEPVWITQNDQFGQIRFVGNWTNTNDNNGPRPQGAITNVTDFCEITFYGTGLNILAQTYASVTAVYSVDGGSEISVPGNLTTSAVINGRNISTNVIANVVSGLALGVHTVKIRQTTSGSPIQIYGFEIINVAATPLNVSTNPGSAYVGGKKLFSSAISTAAYNSVATGTRGGRVLEYLSSAGVVSQAWTAVNGSTLTLSNALSHPNEELFRTYQIAEFGANSSFDFSTVVASEQRAFTLDDNSTSLTASNTAINYSYNNRVGYTWASGGNTAFTFVGTGADVILTIGPGEAGTYTLSIDGTSIGAIPYTAPTTGFTTKIYPLASGLPYGTHTVRITHSGTTPSAITINSWNAYQPKKPTLPSGAIELADYNVLANYVASTTTALDNVSTGVIQKANTREFAFVGTWSCGIQSQVNTGYNTTSSTNGSYFEYVFVGTGIEINGQVGTSGTGTILIDGATPTTTVVANGGSYGAGTWTLGTGLGQTLQITGLTFGVHKVRFTLTASSGGFGIQSVYVITPIYSAKSNLYYDVQNTASVGNTAISDNRKLTPVSGLSSVKAWAQAVGATSGPTTTATTPVPMPDMSLTVKTTGGPVDLDFVCTFIQSSANNIFCQLYVDGSPVGQQQGAVPVASNAGIQVYNFISLPLSAGTHKFDVYWWGSVGTTTAVTTERVLRVRER